LIKSNTVAIGKKIVYDIQKTKPIGTPLKIMAVKKINAFFSNRFVKETYFSSDIISSFFKYFDFNIFHAILMEEYMKMTQSYRFSIEPELENALRYSILRTIKTSIRMEDYERYFNQVSEKFRNLGFYEGFKYKNRGKFSGISDEALKFKGISIAAYRTYIKLISV